ncbi:ATP-binding protein [Candidatus Poribacteria bacterium]
MLADRAKNSGRESNMTQRVVNSKTMEESNYGNPVSEDEVRIILNATLDGVMVQNENHEMEFANSAAIEMLGDDTEHVCHELVERADSHTVCPIHCIIDESGEVPGFCFDRDERHFRVRVTTLGDGTSKTVVVVRDITCVKEVQQQLEHSQKLKELGQMTLGVVHDLNNVLSAILGRAQLLRQNPHDQKAIKPGLEIIEKAALDATETMKRIQHFTRSAKDADFVPVNPGEIVSDVVEITRPRWQDQAQKNGINITVFVRSGRVPPVMGNATDLREALTNLMLNSIEAMPDGGSIRLRTLLDEESVCMSISDTGKGMAKHVVEKAFEPFFTTKGMDNSGLGLGIACGIIEGHNGEMVIDSEEGRGTTITIRLPAAESTQRVRRPAQLHTRSTTANILVIDDEAAIRQLFYEILIRDKHKVTRAPGSREGLQAFDEGDYDIVYTDLGMPDMSGWEVASEIKKRDPSTIVVMTTGWELQMDAEELKKSGIDFVISKPFQIQQIRNSVAQAMKMRGKTANIESQDQSIVPTCQIAP